MLSWFDDPRTVIYVASCFFWNELLKYVFLKLLNRRYSHFGFFCLYCCLWIFYISCIIEFGLFSCKNDGSNVAFIFMFYFYSILTKLLFSSELRLCICIVSDTVLFCVSINFIMYLFGLWVENELNFVKESDFSWARLSLCSWLDSPIILYFSASLNYTLAFSTNLELIGTIVWVW